MPETRTDWSTDGLWPAYEEEFRRSPPRTCAGGASHPAMARVSDDKLQRFHPEKEQMCVAARERHPEWIENYNHYLAIVDEMRREENTLRPE